MATPDLDAVVVGSGPNGLAAAITLAREGLSVRVLEAADTPGGGLRSAELTQPGFIHDPCATVLALLRASPFLRSLPLAEHGLELVDPSAPVAHPLDGGRAAMLYRSVDETADSLGRDAHAYRRLFGPLVEDAEQLYGDLLGPLRPPKHPLLAARFGLSGIRPASPFACSTFQDDPARALFAGLAGHAVLSFDHWGTTAFALMLGIAGHALGWPLAKGGSGAAGMALVRHLESLGGEVVTGFEVKSLDDLPPARAVILDLTPRQVVRIAGEKLPARYVRRLERYRYGAAAFKLDWALSSPIPWTNPEVARAGTVHLGGTLDEIADAERAVFEGRHPDRPYVLLVQATNFDPTRAPADKHTGWAYCHVPNGSNLDQTDAIERQVERFAPGFRDLILDRRVTAPRDLEAYDANYIGGDINGGAQDVRQLFTRPVASLDPYATPLPWLTLGSSSTPPGGGAHGLCGHFAARSALRRVFGRKLA